MGTASMNTATPAAEYTGTQSSYEEEDVSGTGMDEITNDEEFLEHTKKVKGLIDVDYIDDLKPQQAEQLRMELAMILRYVMRRIDEEEQSQSEPSGSAPSSEPPVPEQPVVQQEGQPMSGGKTKQKKGKRASYKGGSKIPIESVLNTSTIPYEGRDPSNMIGSMELASAKMVRSANSAGAITGFTATSGLSESDINGMLPYYGTGGKMGKRVQKKK